ncbi:hypothetical protein ACH5RR_015405 [Cinchona calisaya]|uniref:MULE transposase domain-containing protein n=1 Tax=Cinchona calisaya TaxID=153742 RepID=A0ABD2ZT19_9GENT
MQVYRAKKNALEEIEGSHGTSYSKLPKYVELVRHHNLGSICKIHYDMPNLIMKEPRFFRMFISFKAQNDEFLEDGNNRFPLVVVMSETKNREVWCSFLHFFEKYFGPFDSHVPLTFMSDRQKGLNLAYEEKIPQGDVRYYCRHIYNNAKLQFPRLLQRNYSWEATKSFDILGHNKAKKFLTWGLMEK